MILNEYLATSNIEGLLKILREWVVEDGENIFDLQKVILKTRTMLKTVKIVDENTKRRAVLLSETLAMLYRAAGEHKNALQIHLSSPEPPAVPRNVFVMLETHNLLSDSLEENLGAYIDRSRQERETNSKRQPSHQRHITKLSPTLSHSLNERLEFTTRTKESQKRCRVSRTTSAQLTCATTGPGEGKT